MLEPRTDANLVQLHKQLRQTLIDMHAELVAEKIVKLKKLTVQEGAAAISAEFLGSQL